MSNINFTEAFHRFGIKGKIRFCLQPPDQAHSRIGLKRLQASPLPWLH